MSADTKNPNDPRRFSRGYPDDQERRFEELFSRTTKVADVPAQVTSLGAASDALGVRIVALEGATPDTLAAGIFRSGTGFQVCSSTVTSTTAASFYFVFPQPFLGLPIVTSTPANSGGTLQFVELFDLTNIRAEMRMWRWDPAVKDFVGVTAPSTVHIVAVGKWK